MTGTEPLDGAPLVAFVASSDLNRSRAFYEGVLGLTVLEQNPGALVLVSGGTVLRVTAVPEVLMAPYTVLGWTVTDIVATVEALSTRGVACNRYEGMGQDPRGIWTTPGGDRVAWFPDPDGHVLSLTQPAN